MTEDITEGFSKEKSIELENSEKKLNALFEKRNKHNDEAKFCRNERNRFQDLRKKIFGELDAIKSERDTIIRSLREEKDFAVTRFKVQRDQLNSRVQSHKQQRNTYRNSINEMRGGKDKKKETIDPLSQISILTMEINELERQYEMQALSMKKENEVLDKIKEKSRKIKELKELLPEFEKKRVEESNFAQSIDEMYKKMEKEHGSLSDISQQAQNYHQQMVEVMKKYDKIIQDNYDKYKNKLKEVSTKLTHLKKEADRMHEDFIKARERADYYHNKATELREKVLLLRKERWEVQQKRKQLLEEQNKQVFNELQNEDKLDEKTDLALELLKKGGKISL